MPPKRRQKHVAAALSKMSEGRPAIEEESPVLSGDIIDDKMADDSDMKSKRAKSSPIHLKSAEQDAIIEWFKDHPCLYDKSDPDYKLTHKKNALWDEIAKDVAEGKYSGK